MWKVQFTAVAAIWCAAIWAGDRQTSTRGRELYEKRCGGCHSLDSIKVGPPLRGVFGRRAGADPTFPYSDALKKTKLTWDEGSLDRWLADPEAVAADNDMAFRMSQADERAAIIEYLKHLREKQGRP